MSKTKRSYVLLTVLLFIIVGMVGGWIYSQAFPQNYFNGYPAIPVYFLMMGIASINILERGRGKSPVRMLQIYMLVRVVRMIVSLLFMVVYCLAVREEALTFMLTFIVYYLIYIIYDSWFFYKLEGNQKKEKGELK